MYHEETDTACIPKSWNLADDLGQIEYIFSDKTGTLTRNVMEFRQCSINGRGYGFTWSEKVNDLKDSDKTEAEKFDAEARLMLAEMRKVSPSLAAEAVSHLTFADSRLYQHLQVGDDHAAKIREFFTCIAVCHTVLIDANRKHQEKDHAVSSMGPHGSIRYQAQSPDEAALVTAAKDLGFAFLKREHEDVTCSILGAEEKFTVLNVLEFNSDRKRMSVIVRKNFTGEIVLYCKGADVVIFERLKQDDHGPDHSKPSLKERSTEHLKVFASEGKFHLSGKPQLIGFSPRRG
jgi:phospholipid-translocating ATPase